MNFSVAIRMMGLSFFVGLFACKAEVGDRCRDEDDCGDLVCCKGSPSPNAHGFCEVECNAIPERDASVGIDSAVSMDANIEDAAVLDATEDVEIDSTTGEDAAQDATMEDSAVDEDSAVAQDSAVEVDSGPPDVGVDSGPPDVGVDSNGT